MECRNSKKIPSSSPHLFRKGKNQYKLKKTTEKLRTPENPYRAEMTGDSCMARAVVPSTAAAIDHANAKLFGHDGKSETPGFFAVEQYSSLHISIFIPQRHKLENSHSNFLSRRILLAYSNHSLSISGTMSTFISTTCFDNRTFTRITRSAGTGIFITILI